MSDDNSIANIDAWGRKSSNIEDRTKEFGEMEHLLHLVMGTPLPVKQPYADQYGLEPGKYLEHDNLPTAPITYLGLDAGIPELINLATQQDEKRYAANRARNAEQEATRANDENAFPNRRKK